MTASTGLATDILLDFSHIGITVLPVNVILHHTGLVLSIGFIIAGSDIRATSEKRANGFVIERKARWAMRRMVMLLVVIRK